MGPTDFPVNAIGFGSLVFFDFIVLHVLNLAPVMGIHDLASELDFDVTGRTA
jgi:hypothetical protein